MIKNCRVFDYLGSRYKVIRTIPSNSDFLAWVKSIAIKKTVEVSKGAVSENYLSKNFGISGNVFSLGFWDCNGFFKER